MAHRISYKPKGIIFSSVIDNIVIMADGSYVDVTLAAPGGFVILKERYYAHGGTVTLFDLASLIESHLRSTGLLYADFTLSAFSDSPENNADSCVLHVLYCDRFTVCSDVPKFLKENFLTTLAYRRIPPNAPILLSFYAENGESGAFHISYSFRKKNSDALFRHSCILHSDLTVSKSDIIQYEIYQYEIIEDAASFAGVPSTEIELTSFVISCGQRSLSFFIDPTLDLRRVFFFRNCFNAWDWASFPYTMSAKTDVERSMAVINGRSNFYNRSTNQTYEVQAGPLSSDEAEWIDQLFTSYEVLRIEENKVDPYNLPIPVPVLITDCSCEVQDGDEKLNSVKFTWRYADNRPIVRLSASPGIFTSPYDPVFS